MKILAYMLALALALSIGGHEVMLRSLILRDAQCQYMEIKLAEQTAVITMLMYNATNSTREVLPGKINPYSRPPRLTPMPKFSGPKFKSIGWSSNTTPNPLRTDLEDQIINVTFTAVAAVLALWVVSQWLHIRANERYIDELNDRIIILETDLAIMEAE